MASECWAKQGNIGHRGQNRRLRMSIVMLTVGMGLAVFLIKSDFPVWTRAFVFVPMLMAAMGGFQGLHQNCFFAAFRGIREMDDGDHQIADGKERARMKREAYRVLAESFATASIATALVLIVP